jgi:arylsulfatase A-like enzyme
LATSPEAGRGSRPGRLLLFAVWAGLLAGILEAVIGLLLQSLGWPLRVPLTILWIAPAFNVLLFTAAGVVLGAATAHPRLNRRRIWVTALLFGLVFGLIQAADLMRPGAALLLALGLAIAMSRPLPAPAWWEGLARRSLRPLVVVAALCAAVGLAVPWLLERRFVAALSAAEAGLPNVLLITLDTLRADHVSAYGYSRTTTPNLDALARRGILFEHAFANSSWTLPSHASLFTGRYPHEHGADWLSPMQAGIPTLAEAFAAKGYLTAAFAANTSYVSPEWGLGRGFGRFEVYGGSWADRAVRTAYGRRLALNVLPRLGFFDIVGRKRARQVNDQFLTWLDGERVDRPFFAFLNYLDVHDPYLTEAEHHRRFSPHPARGVLINFQFQPHAFRRKPTLTHAEIQAEIDAYDGCLTYLDAQIGALVTQLADRGLDSNTLIVITSDHGESFGNHDLFGHGNSLYLETLRVPLLVIWPGRVPGGVRIGDPVGLERVPATIDALVGLSAGAPTFPGRSLALYWSSDTDRESLSVPVLSEVSHVDKGPPGYPTSAGSLRSLITREWHVIVSSSGSTELYDRQHDAMEVTNVASDDAARQVLERLRELISTIRSGAAASPEASR